MVRMVLYERRVTLLFTRFVCSSRQQQCYVYEEYPCDSFPANLNGNKSVGSFTGSRKGEGKRISLESK